MLRRHGFLFFSAFATLLTACIEAPEETAAKEPPAVKTKQKQSPATMVASSGMQAAVNAAPNPGMPVKTATPAADGVSAAARDAGSDVEMDAGPISAGSGGHGGAAAGSGGTAGRLAAGSGGLGGAGGGRAAGSGGRGGSGGQAGGASQACMNQLCFTVFDCWLLSEADCNYTECADFICK